jgi:hypothetical protein
MSSFRLPTRSSIAKPLLALALGAALATLAACGSDTTNGTGPMDVSGSYNLATVDGSSLPYTVPETDENVIVVTGGTASLYNSPNNTYALSVGGTENGRTEFVSDAGSYSVSGSTVTFVSSSFPGASYTGVATSSGITATVPGQIVSSHRVSFSLVFDKAP